MMSSSPGSSGSASLRWLQQLPQLLTATRPWLRQLLTATRPSACCRRCSKLSQRPLPTAARPASRRCQRQPCRSSSRLGQRRSPCELTRSRSGVTSAGSTRTSGVPTAATIRFAQSAGVKHTRPLGRTLRFGGTALCRAQPIASRPPCRRRRRMLRWRRRQRRCPAPAAGPKRSSARPAAPLRMCFAPTVTTRPSARTVGGTSIR